MFIPLFLLKKKNAKKSSKVRPSTRKTFSNQCYCQSPCTTHICWHLFAFQVYYIFYITRTLCSVSYSYLKMCPLHNLYALMAFSVHSIMKNEENICQRKTFSCIYLPSVPTQLSAPIVAAQFAWPVFPQKALDVHFPPFSFPLLPALRAFVQFLDVAFAMVRNKKTLESEASFCNGVYDMAYTNK